MIVLMEHYCWTSVHMELRTGTVFVSHAALTTTAGAGQKTIIGPSPMGF
jgi:hypothetical protein